MKFTRILSALIIGSLLYVSCQKPLEGELPPPTSNVSQRVKTYTEDIVSDTNHLSVTFNLSYDANGRLISMISAASPGDKFLYQYSGNTVTMDHYNSNVLSIHEIVYLNSSSFADSTIQHSEGDTTTEKYIYNSANQLITIKEYDYTTAGGSQLYGTYSYVYSADGDATRESYSGFGSYVNTFEYYTQLNTPSVGFDFLPRNKHLVKTTHYTSGGPQTLNHTYTFDSNNRLTIEKIVSSEGFTATRTYTY